MTQRITGPDIYENYRHLDIFIGSETYYNVMCQTEGYTGGRADIRRVLRAIQSQAEDRDLYFWR